MREKIDLINNKNILRLLSVGLALLPVSALAGSLTVKVIDQNEKPVSNAVVKLTPQNHNPVLNPQDSVIDQINKEYVPRVILVIKGSDVSFPNKDNIKHHVYSFSKSKQFELPLYKGTPAEPVNFEQDGVVTLGCNIHDWMRGYIFVSDSPYAAISDQQGKLLIKNLPSDTYTMEVWHPQSTVTVSKQGFSVSEVSSLQHTENITLKPEIKIRRNKSKKRRRYR